MEDPDLTYTSGALDLSRRLAHLEEDPLNTLETFSHLDSHLRMATLNVNGLDGDKLLILLRYIDIYIGTTGYAPQQTRVPDDVVAHSRAF